MAATIREQIIAAYMARLASWTVTNGYNYDCGASATRAVLSIEPNNLPACVLWPKSEEVVQRYGQNICEMVARVEALSEIAAEVNPSVIQEKLLGDAIKIMTDPSTIVSTKIEDIAYMSGGPVGGVKPEEKTTAIFADFKIKYFTLIGDPYSQ